MRFNVYFQVGKHEQWVEFVLEKALDDVYWTNPKPKGSWASYTPIEGRKLRKGKFAVIELPLMDNNSLFRGSVQHEIDHLVIDYFLCRSNGKIDRNNEEKFATLAGDIATEFWDEYEKQKR